MTEIVADPRPGRDPEPARRTPTMHESETPVLATVLAAIGRALILAGIVVFLFVAYQLWGTNVQEARSQDSLRDELTERFGTLSTEFDPTVFAAPVVEAGPSDPEPDTVAGGDTDLDRPPGDLPIPSTTVAPPELDDELLALLFPDDGDALAEIRIPSIDVDKVVVGGVAVADLRKGPGHYSQTPLPGNPGNASIAGHRTTYGAPFNRIDELVPGDEITVTSIQGEFTYRVLDPAQAYADDLSRVEGIGTGHIIVDPSAVWVLGDFDDDRLTLTACHPKRSSRQRIIVAAELVDDPVAVPEWALAAAADRLAAAGPGVAGAEASAADDLAVADEPGADEPPNAETSDQSVATPTTPPTASTADLDEGLAGERDAIAPAVAWMIAALAFWYAGGRLGRRFATGRPGRLALRLAGLVPAGVCLWFSFELIDRALPAA